MRPILTVSYANALPAASAPKASKAIAPVMDLDNIALPPFQIVSFFIVLTGLLAANISIYPCRYDIAVVGVANVVCDIGVDETTAARTVLTRMNIGDWSRFVM
jgi:hypothetical protein